jgi:hypothetical protein
VPEVAVAATEALRSLEVNSSRACSRAGSAAAPLPASLAPPQPLAQAQAQAAQQAPALDRVSSGLFKKSNSWGRRSSQTLTLEQVPPEVAAAEAAAAVAADPHGAAVGLASPPRPPLPPGTRGAAQHAQHATASPFASPR